MMDDGAVVDTAKIDFTARRPESFAWQLLRPLLVSQLPLHFL